MNHIYFSNLSRHVHDKTKTKIDLVATSTIIPHLKFTYNTPILIVCMKRFLKIIFLIRTRKRYSKSMNIVRKGSYSYLQDIRYHIEKTRNNFNRMDKPRKKAMT